MSQSPFKPMQPGADEIDYRETADVSRVHGAVKREHQEPEVGTFPVPLWLITVVTVLMAIAFFYFGAYNGSFSAQVYNPLDGAVRSTGGAAAEGEGAAKELSLAEQGEKIYKANCIQCHQGNGAGSDVYPALAGSEWVNGPSLRVTMLVLKGMEGPHTAKGKVFNSAMPPWGGTLNDKKLAAVLSYIRSAWGNQASEITPEQVAKVRELTGGHPSSYTHDELAAVNEEIPAN